VERRGSEADPLNPGIRRDRSCRRRPRLTAVAIAVAAVAVPIGWLGLSGHLPLVGGAPTVTRSPSLPERIGAPGKWSPSITHAPIDGASVVFGDGDWGLDNLPDDTALTAARSDAYRRVPNSAVAIAGITAILSPDGRRLAVENGFIDVTTGHVVRLAPKRSGDYREPEAWSPDGRELATVEYTEPDFLPPLTYTGAWTNPATRASLAVVDVASGHETRIADLNLTTPYDGWLAAFSPDGSKLAYQSGDQVVVVTRSGQAVSRFTVANGTRLAGKGAWTRDGSGLALVAETPCGCGRTYDSRWTMTVVDADTGAARATSYVLDGVVAIRLLGWSPTSEPVVVAYHPLGPSDLDPGNRPVTFRTGPPDASGVDQNGLAVDGIELLDDVDTADVVALREGRAPRTMLTSTATGAGSLDVADNVIAGGLTRPGDPPLLTANMVDAMVPVGILVAIAAAVVVGPLLLMRRRRARRRSSGDSYAGSRRIAG